MESYIAKHKLYELIIPSTLMCMAGNLTAIFDSIFISTFINTNALGAIQLLMPLISIIPVLEWMFGLGGQIISLNKKAEFKEREGNAYFTLSVISVMVVSIIFTLFNFLDVEAVLTSLHATPATIHYMRDYLPFLLINIPITCFVSILTQFIRVDKKAKFASFIIIVANIINIVLDVIFLYYFKIGVAGASLASLIGYSVSAILIFKYFFDKNRTFKFVRITGTIKSKIGKFINICKVGFPGASVELCFVIVAYFMNFVLTRTLHDPGLSMYAICEDALLVISIVLVGFVESLTSLTPIYYSQDDYKNVKFLFKRSVIVMLGCSIAFTLFLIISPETFLGLYNIHSGNSNIVTYVNALRLFSITFILQALVTLLIFYYESIEKIILSGILSFVSIVIGPVLFTMFLLPVIGTNIIWLSFSFGCALALFLTYIAIKFNQRKESKYKGILFINEELIPNTRNYEIEPDNKIQMSEELIKHMKTLKINNEYCDIIRNIIDKVFEYNENNVDMEVLLIKYEDNVKINIKDDGKENILENIGDDFITDEVKYNKIIGLNSFELIIPN